MPSQEILHHVESKATIMDILVLVYHGSSRTPPTFTGKRDFMNLESFSNL